MNNHPNRGGRRSEYRTPTPAELAAAQHHTGWSDQDCADAVCVPAPTWRSWKAGERTMPAGAWALFRIRAGMMKP